MQLGIFNLLSYVPELDGAGADVLRRLLDDATYAEDLGFDSFWLTEHHFENFGALLSQPAIVLGALAQRTTRMRLGIAVALLPLHHPLSLAEQWATVDVLTDGRLDLGIGKGFFSWEYANFGLQFADAGARYDEHLDAMLAAWAPGRFDFESSRYHFRDLQVLPRPLQQPHPPIWASAVRTRESYEWAGRRGFHLMTAPHLIDPATMDEWLTLYRQALVAEGYDPAERQILANLHVFVAPTRAEAIAVAAPCLERTNFVRLTAARREPDFEATQARRRYASTQPASMDAQIEEGKLIVGSPADCIRGLQLLHERLGVTHFIGTFYYGGMAHTDVRRSMELFMREVAPHVRGAEPPAGLPSTLAPAPAAR